MASIFPGLQHPLGRGGEQKRADLGLDRKDQ